MAGFLIRNGLAVTPEGKFTADILVEDGRISRVCPAESAETATPADGTACGQFPDDCEVFDATGCIVCTSLADVHVHFRVPGRPDKEDMRSGSMAAAHGGYGCVCAMPNLSPAPDSPENIAVEQALIDSDAVIDVRPYATITKGRAGKEIVDVDALAGRCAGFSDDGSGVQDGDMMKEAMKRVAKAGGILAAHCEDNSLLDGGYIHKGRYAAAHGHRGICSESEWGPIVRDVALAAQTGCAYHVCHISTKESVEAIRRAKALGTDVSCETGPHYLALCEDDLQEDGRFKMNPPLRSGEDRDALIAGILDGTIDMIATDHAPHTAAEKAKGLEGSAMGVVGLETAFGVMYTRFVKNGRMDIGDLVRLMCWTPRKRFALGGALEEGQDADIAVFDVTTPWTVRGAHFLSKGAATPFEGMELYGKCILNLFKGIPVWKEKTI